MAALNLSELAKRDNALLVYNKIIKKTPFELNNKTEIELKFNLDVKGIATAFKTQDLKKIKELSSDKLTKMFFVDKNKKVYKLTDLFKSEEFGGGSGSGGGASDTAVTESMQCYYSALRYKLGEKLHSGNATPKALKDKSLQGYVFAFEGSTRWTASTLLAAHTNTTSKALPTWIEYDTDGQNVYTKTANALAANQKWSGDIYFHRGSPFMSAIYESKKTALEFDKTLNSKAKKAPSSGFSDDKWNPGDIWMSTMSPNPGTSQPLDFGKAENCNLTFDQLRKNVYKLAKSQELLGVSLKKVISTAKVTMFNTYPSRKQNTNVTLNGFTFGQSGDFFNSADIYLKLGDKQVQFRSTASTKSWQGEVKGAAAAAGKIGGGGVNFYCFDILKTTIGSVPKDAKKWKETLWNDNMFPHFHKLYMKYSIHPGNKLKTNKKVKPQKNFTVIKDLAVFKQMANGYINSKNKNAGPAFKFSKYMGLLLLDAIYTSKGSKNEWATQVLRYAMSNIDISTYFIKIE